MGGDVVQLAGHGRALLRARLADEGVLLARERTQLVLPGVPDLPSRRDEQGDERGNADDERRLGERRRDHEARRQLAVAQAGDEVADERQRRCGEARRTHHVERPLDERDEARYRERERRQAVRAVERGPRQDERDSDDERARRDEQKHRPRRGADPEQRDGLGGERGSRCPPHRRTESWDVAGDVGVDAGRERERHHRPDRDRPAHGCRDDVTALRRREAGGVGHRPNSRT